MNKRFGEFMRDFPPDHDCLELSFTPHSGQIKNRWRNQRLSAHFLADYFSNFLPLDKENPEEEERIKHTQGAISYVANELLENAMKFNQDRVDYKVKLGIHFLEQSELTAVLFARNNVDHQGAEQFQGFIQTLLTSDPEEFYVQQVEASAMDENVELSGLGFLTMLNDYKVTLGWQFETSPSDPHVILVTTMAQIPV